MFQQDCTIKPLFYKTTPRIHRRPLKARHLVTFNISRSRIRLMFFFVCSINYSSIDEIFVYCVQFQVFTPMNELMVEYYRLHLRLAYCNNLILNYHEGKRLTNEIYLHLFYICLDFNKPWQSIKLYAVKTNTRECSYV